MKKKQNEKKKKTTSEIISEVRNEFKDEESKYQILDNAGGNYIKTKLPKDFFENITFGEMSLEYDFSIEKLTQLMDLYSLGIQYYLENNPKKAKHFQDRMGFILTNKDTLVKLKRQQEQEQREKLEKEKSKTEKKDDKNEKNDKKEILAKSAKNLPRTNMRKRAKTNFMMKSQNIKEEDIHKKVSFVLKNGSKEEKENVKNIINDDIDKQNLKWKEKLKIKKNNLNKSFGNGIRPRNRTFFAKMKKFQTPGPAQDRQVMTLKSPNNPKSPNQNPSNFKIGINKNDNKTSNNAFTKFVDIESSDADEIEKIEGDIDFIKKFKEKHNWKEEEKKKNNEDKNEKKNEEDEDDDSDSDSDSSGTLNSDEFLKKIDEVDEEDEKRKSLRKSKALGLNKKNDEKKVSEFKIQDDNHDSDKEKEEEKEKEKEQEKEKEKEKEKEEEKEKEKEKEEEKKQENEHEKEQEKEKINENMIKEKEENKENLISEKETGEKNVNRTFKKKTSIVEEVNLLRNIDPDEEIVKIIDEKMKILEKLNNINNITNKGDEEASELQNDDISSISNNNFNPIQDLKLTIDEIPLKFQDTYTDVEDKMRKYVKDLNNHFYKDTFELFSLELK